MRWIVVSALALGVSACSTSGNVQPMNWNSSDYWSPQTSGGQADSLPYDTDGTTLIIRNGKVTVPQ